MDNFWPVARFLLGAALYVGFQISAVLGLLLIEFEHKSELEVGFSIDEIWLFEEGISFDDEGVVCTGGPIIVSFVVEQSIISAGGDSTSFVTISILLLIVSLWLLPACFDWINDNDTVLSTITSSSSTLLVTRPLFSLSTSSSPWFSTSYRIKIKSEI